MVMYVVKQVWSLVLESELDIKAFDVTTTQTVSIATAQMHLGNFPYWTHTWCDGFLIILGLR